MRTGAVEHGVGMGCAARKSQKPALEIGGGPAVHRFLVSACRSARTTAKSMGGYGGRVRSVALATTRGCSGFHPLVFAGLAAPHFAHVRRGVMPN